jgi:ankyrin repeat protein
LLRVPNAGGTAHRGSPPPQYPAVRRNGHTAVIEAVRNEHHEIVETLIVARADLNTKSNTGCALPLGPSGGGVVGGGFVAAPTVPIAPAPSGRGTALHCAAWNRYTKLVVALLVSGADQTITDNDG